MVSQSEYLLWLWGETGAERIIHNTNLYCVILFYNLQFLYFSLPMQQAHFHEKRTRVLAWEIHTSLVYFLGRSEGNTVILVPFQITRSGT